MGEKLSIFDKMPVEEGGHPRYSGIALDCWSIGQAIDLAPNNKICQRAITVPRMPPHILKSNDTCLVKAIRIKSY